MFSRNFVELFPWGRSGEVHVVELGVGLDPDAIVVVLGVSSRPNSEN